MNLPQSSELNIGYFSRLFDNTTNCYKFFWFKGILKNLEEGRIRITFDDILNEMIADAWQLQKAANDCFKEQNRFLIRCLNDSKN